MTVPPIVAVSATVWLGLASALVLREAAGMHDPSMLALGFLFLLSLIANAGRFVIWGYVYRRHPVSVTYPLGSTIFPLVLLVDHLRYGEPVTAPKVIASVMIMLGVAVLSVGVESEAGEIA